MPMTKAASDWKVLAISQMRPASAMTISKKRSRPLGVMLWMRIHSRCQACCALSFEARSLVCCCSEVPCAASTFLVLTCIFLNNVLFFC